VGLPGPLPGHEDFPFDLVTCSQARWSCLGDGVTQRSYCHRRGTAAPSRCELLGPGIDAVERRVRVEPEEEPPAVRVRQAQRGVRRIGEDPVSGLSSAPLSRLVAVC